MFFFLNIFIKILDSLTKEADFILKIFGKKNQLLNI